MKWVAGKPAEATEVLKATPADTKTAQRLPGPGGEERGADCKGTWGIQRRREQFLIMVVITSLYVFVKTRRIIC